MQQRPILNEKLLSLDAELTLLHATNDPVQPSEQAVAHLPLKLTQQGLKLHNTRDPLANIEQPVQLRYTSLQIHLSTLDDKTASSVRFFPSNSTHGSTDGSHNTSSFEVTYSTRSGVVVALKKNNHSSRFTHAHHTDEVNAQENNTEK